MFRFTTQEVAELCEVSFWTVTGWVRYRFIRPARKGRPGGRGSHLFSPQQALGLASHADLIKLSQFANKMGARASGRRVVAALVKSWEEISDDQLISWMQSPDPDVWQDEAEAQFKLAEALEPDPDIVVSAKTGKRIIRTFEEIKRRILADQAAGRLAAPVPARITGGKKRQKT
jgi:hypothetical protein